MRWSRWWSVAGSMALGFGLAALVGWVVHRPVLALLTALAVALAWNFLRLARLLGWMRGRFLGEPPDYGGIWGETVALISRLFQRKQYYKQRLHGLTRELRQSSAALPDGVVVLNAAAEIMWTNPNAERLLGLRSPQDAGMRIDNLVRQPQFVRYLQSGDYSVPITLRASGPVDQYLMLHLVPYGEAQRLLLVRDVTRAALLEAMRKDFVANASHELRSPLTVISGYLEALAQDATLDAALQVPIAEMRRQATRMGAIVEDLLELSRLEASDRRAGRQAVDVAALLAELEADARARPGQAALGVRVESRMRLLGDAGELRSAFGNLLDNALKYTPPNGQVDVRWSTDSDGGHLVVADTGIGIAAEHLPRLTERFYRVDAGRSRATGGSGLGLAIVKHVLQLHEGWLEIQSEEGKGSRFICHFPATRLADA